MAIDYADIRRRIQALETELNRLESLISVFDREYRELRYSLISDTLYTYAFQDAYTRMGERATEVLLSNAIKACKRSKEYDLPIFIGGLTTAIRRGESITVTHLGGYNVQIDINLDRTAGTLEQWAMGILAYRQILMERKSGRAKFFTPEPRASQMWYEKLYAVARLGRTVTRRVFNRKTKRYEERDVTAYYKQEYFNTIQGRLSESGALAPWWRLLEYGNMNVRLASDKGGTPGPEVKPTHFVSRTIRQLTNEFKLLMSDAYTAVYNRITEQAQSIAEYLYELRASALQVATELAALRAELLHVPPAGRDPVQEARYQGAKVKLQTKLGERFEHADPQRLEMLMNDLANGVRVNPKSGIRLGTDPQGKSIRVRVLRILNEINKELNK